MAISTLLGSSPLEVKAAGFAFNDPASSQPQRDGGYRSNGINNGSGQPDNNGSGGAGQSNSVDIPKFPKVDSVETGQEMLERIKADMAQLEETINSESESENQCEENVRFKNKAIQNLAKKSLKNQNLANEYEGLKKKLKAGTKPYDINRRSCRLKGNKVLVKLAHTVVIW